MSEIKILFLNPGVFINLIINIKTINDQVKIKRKANYAERKC